MEIIIYVAMFIIGAFLGSFYSLAIYRIPLKQDISHERSYCPKCNHKLQFLDLIPIFSYIFLGGKCRYCKEKIRPRYILLEISSGILFLLFTISLKIDVLNLEISKLVYLVFGMLYITTLYLIGGIEKENHVISKNVLLFGIISTFLYMIYLYVLRVNIYKYVIYLFLMLVFILINTVILRKKSKENYTISILTLCQYLVMSTNEKIVILSVIATLWLVAIKEMFSKSNNKKEIPIGFYLCFSNIILFAIQNFIR